MNVWKWIGRRAGQVTLRELQAKREREMLVRDVERLTDRAARLEAELTQRTRDLIDVEQDLERVREEKHGAYHERNQLVAALSKLYPSHTCQHPVEDTAWDPEWLTIVCVHLPTGQVTWHIHLSERPLFAHLPKSANHWDGHTTGEKYRRLAGIDARPLSAGREGPKPPV